MTRSTDHLLRCALAGIFAGTCLLAVSCRKERTMEMPKVRSDLVLDIFRDFDKNDYESVQPKIERYMAIDETNIFLAELQNIVTNNVAIIDARNLADKGDYAGAYKVIETAIANHGEQKDLLIARSRLNELLTLKAQIDELKQPLRAKEQNLAAQKLLAFARSRKRPKLIAFATRKLEEAKQIELVENDRAKFGILADAMEAEQTGELTQAASLTALLMQIDPKYPGIRMIQNGGIFDKKDKGGTERSEL